MSFSVYFFVAYLHFYLSTYLPTYLYFFLPTYVFMKQLMFTTLSQNSMTLFSHLSYCRVFNTDSIEIEDMLISGGQISKKDGICL